MKRKVIFEYFTCTWHNLKTLSPTHRGLAKDYENYPPDKTYTCLAAVRKIHQSGFRKDTEPSYQNDDSDFVPRKPQDQFKNASNTKYIDLFHATFVSTISLKTTIHSINQVNLSSFTHFPYLLPVATKWELQQSMHCPLRQCCHSPGTKSEFSFW